MLSACTRSNRKRKSPCKRRESLASSSQVMIADPSMPIPANASPAGCPTYAVAKLPWAASPDLRHLRHHLDRVVFEPATAIARSAHYEDRGFSKDPVERAGQGLVPHEELAPKALRHVASGNHGGGPLLLAATIDYAKGEVGARFVENAPSDLVRDQARRPRRRRGVAALILEKTSPPKVLASLLVARRARQHPC